MVLLRCCASLMVFLTIVGIWLGLGAWLWITKNAFVSTSQDYKYCLYGSYAVWGLDGLYTIIVLCLCNRIRLGVVIMKCTAQFIGSTPQVFLVPIIFSILCGIWVAAWGFTAIYLFSIGDIQPRPAPLEFVTEVIWVPQTRYLCLYHLFGLLWVNAFLIGSA